MAILSKGTTYSDGDQVTSTNLNALVDSATFASDAVDDSTTQLSSGKIIVKDLGIATGKLATSAVTTAKIAGSNVTTAKIAAANITTSLIADSNVTKAKIENLADYKVLGNVSGGAAAPAEVAILDEDNMSSNSATSLATQQSIKAYVDTQLTAEDLDFAGDSGSSSVDLDGQTFTIAGATGLDTAASGQTLTVSLDLNELATETSIAQDDFVAMVDNTDSGNGKITFSNLEDQVFGNVSGAVAIAAGGAATVSAVTVADESSDTTCFPLFATAATGSLGPKSGSNLTFNSSTGLLTATTLSGILANGVTGTTQSSGDNSTKVATTAYVDAQVATSDALSEVLAVGNTTGSTNIVVSNGQSITTNTIAETTSGSGVTIDGVLIKDNAITASGEIDGGSLDISGNADIDGTLETDALSIASTAVTATAAELNYNDTGASVGTVVASKTVTVDSNKDVSSFRNITLTGELDAATLDISGDADIDGTLEADAITVDGTALATVIAGTTVTNATNSAHVLVTDNESTNEENLITFVEGATSSTGNVGLEMDGNFAYNPSTGTVSATIFKGNIDAVDGDFDGTLETDALSIGGTTVTSTAAELNYLDITTLGTSEASKAVTVDSNGDLLVPDSDKFKFGTGSDMQVYHDGTNSYIENSTGELKLATETSGIAIAIGHSTSEATFGDNVTITGNLTVNGTTTTVNTTNLTVTDPLVKFGEGYTGSAFDEGFIVTRGNGSASNTANKGFIWDESADEFAAIACNTEDGTTAGNVTINSYADLQVGKLTGGSLDISGDIDVDGTTNLDVVDIDGAVDMASTLTVAGDTVLNSNLEINVAGSSNTSKAIVINSSGTNFESDGGMIRLLHPSTGSGALTGGFFMKFNANSADKFTVKGNGDTTIAGELTVADDANFDSGTLFVDASANKVGVGTTAPDELLHVKGGSDRPLVVESTDAFCFISLNDNSTSAQSAVMIGAQGDDLRIDAGDSERIRVESNGNVGINDSTPSERLSVSGNVSISGSLSKGSGSFKIPHPLESKRDTHNLVHSFLESPQADLIYRGRVDLVDGLASVNIDLASDMTDGTFVVLCRDVQSFTTNESGWTAVRSSVDGNILTIEAQDNTCTDSISWMVVGERQDEHMYDTEWTDENGKVIVEPLIPEPIPEPEEEEVTEEG